MPIQAALPDGAGVARGVSGVLFITAYGNFWEVVSALNSSPWTSENFGADQAKADSARRFVRHSIVRGSAAAAFAGYLSRSWWPVVAAGVAAADVWVLYQRALARAQQSGSVGWGTGQDMGGRKLRWLP